MCLITALVVVKFILIISRADFLDRVAPLKLVEFKKFRPIKTSKRTLQSSDWSSPQIIKTDNPKFWNNTSIKISDDGWKYDKDTDE